MKEIMLWGICMASGIASENTVKADQLPAEIRTNYHTQLVEKEIGEYTKLLEGIKQESRPLGAMLKAHYSEHLGHLQTLLTSGEMGKNIEGELYKLHLTDSLFARYY